MFSFDLADAAFAESPHGQSRVKAHGRHHHYYRRRSVPVSFSYGRWYLLLEIKSEDTLALPLAVGYVMEGRNALMNY